MKYPVHRVHIRWQCDILANENWHGNWIRGCRPGKHWNGLIYYDMPGPVNGQAKYDEYDKKGQNPILESIEVVHVHDETWCPGWFSHWTFDVGDADYEKSFVDYVSRHQDNLGLLMGAERGWRGVCRCEHCKARGIVRIDHP